MNYIINKAFLIKLFLFKERDLYFWSPCFSLFSSKYFVTLNTWIWPCGPKMFVFILNNQRIVSCVSLLIEYITVTMRCSNSTRKNVMNSRNLFHTWAGVWDSHCCSNEMAIWRVAYLVQGVILFVNFS